MQQGASNSQMDLKQDSGMFYDKFAIKKWKTQIHGIW